MSIFTRSIFGLLRWTSTSFRPVGQRLISWLLTNMSFLIPTKHLYESETLIAFHHPQPSYVLHIILLPKKEIANLREFDPTENQQLLIDLFQAVGELVYEFQMDTGGYRLVANGGKFQEFPYLHFHLISDVNPE